jgi:hypothetical protein
VFGFMLIAALIAADPVTVEVSTLDGRTVTGRIDGLSADALTLVRDSGQVRIPTADLLDIRSTVATPPASAGEALYAVALQDGSRFRSRLLGVKGALLQVEHPVWGPLGFPVAQVRTLQFAADEPALQAAWKQLADRPAKKDMLVVRKGDVLDHLDGVVGQIDEQTVSFLLDGDSISVKRERVFGVIYSKKDVPAAKDALRVEFAGGDTLSVRQVAWTNGQWQIDLGGKRQFSVPANGVQRLDYSQGKVLYLSAIEPREVKYTPFIGPTFEFPYQRDRHIWGGPLRLGGRTYARGLAIHSKTLLRYRLGGEYRRFTAMMGMDPEYRYDPGRKDEAKVELRGDGRVLFAADVMAGDPPQALELSVDGVVELEILVDFGRDNLDIGDRIHFGEAKVVK